MEKNLVLGLILAHLAQLWAANFFSKIWLRQSLDVMVRYYHVQYQKKLMIPSWENFNQTDRQTDRRPNCPTNVERRIIQILFWWSLILDDLVHADPIQT